MSIPTEKTCVFLGNDGESCWLEIAGGTGRNGNPHPMSAKKWPLEVLQFSDDESGLPAYVATMVRKVAAQTGAETMSETLKGFLPDGFTMRPPTLIEKMFYRAG